jgi:hypothetical protein
MKKYPKSSAVTKKGSGGKDSKFVPGHKNLMYTHAKKGR